MNSNHRYRTQHLSQFQKQKVVKRLLRIAKRKTDQVCNKNVGKECAIAWDTVTDYETVLRRIDHNLREDSLEKLCDIEPDLDECRIHDV